MISQTSDTLQKELDAVRKARDDNWNGWQGEKQMHMHCESQLDGLQGLLKTKEQLLADLGKQLQDCQNKPPQVIEKPVEKLVYVKETIAAKDIQKLGFFDRLKLLFS